ncbi:MAG: IS21 family transposase [Coriobacteriales bacterium]|nr:IS21 family transposase [Coriobacteriales bacterium]
MTRKLLWYEYGNTTIPSGKRLYQYSQFCALLAEHLVINNATARVKHIPGRMVFVGWAGGTLALRDKITGRDHEVYLFVACLPWSDYFFVEGFLDLTQRSWITGHIHAFDYFGGVPVIVTPDRCATAVDRTPIYVTKINQTYNDFIEYYGAAVLPTRSERPRDKSGVESAVGLCERWIIAPLRNEVFFTLDEINSIIHEINDRLNAQPFQVRAGSRRSSFLTEERHLLKELPPVCYEISEWRKAKVNHDYHVQVDYMRYSVDYHLIGKEVSVRISDTRIVIYHNNNQVAEHTRLFGRKGSYSTMESHMPTNHRYISSSWSPECFLDWAASIGTNTVVVIKALMDSKPIIEQSFVSCANILGLARRSRKDLLEAACEHIVGSGALSISYSRVKNTLEAISRSTKSGESAAASLADIKDAAPRIGRLHEAAYYRRTGDDDAT